MSFQSVKYFEEILMYLSVLRYIFKSRSKRRLYDLNKKAEPFFRRLINLIYSWNLKDLDTIQANYPAIDLGDEVKRVCVQVTAENNSRKIKYTINKFVEKKLYKSYKRIIILILTEKKNYTANFDTGGAFSFDKANDIIDIDDLLSQIDNLDIESLENIHKYLSKEISPVVRLFADKGSLLSQIPDFSGTKPSESKAFFKHLGLTGKEIEQGKIEVLSLYKKLESLSTRSREYLFLLIDRSKENGAVVGGIDHLYAFPADIESYSGLTRAESEEEFQVLEANDLVYNEPDEYQPRIEISFPMDIGVDLFMMIKQFLNDSSKLKRVIVDCDFGLLNG